MLVVSTVFGVLRERRQWRKGGWLKEKGKAHSRGNPCADGGFFEPRQAAMAGVSILHWPISPGVAQ
jgi:hypothetical protein